MRKALRVLSLALLALAIPAAARAQSTWTAGTCGAGVTLSNGNLTASRATGNAWQSCRSTSTGHATGKWYFEESITAVDGSHGIIVGMMNASGPTANFSGSDTNSVGIQDVGTGDLYYNGVQHAGVGGNCSKSGAGPPFTVGFAVNAGVEFWCTIDGVNWSPAASSPSTPGSGFNFIASISGAIFPALSMLGASAADTGTLATSSFTFSAPAGFTAWDSAAGIVGAGNIMLMGVGK